MRQEGVLLALLKRCTSSTKTMVRAAGRGARPAACSTASRMSFTPPSTRRQHDELRIERTGHQPRQRGLADARRAPQDHRVQLRRTRRPRAAACPGPAGAAGRSPRPACAGAGARPAAHRAHRRRHGSSASVPARDMRRLSQRLSAASEARAAPPHCSITSAPAGGMKRNARPRIATLATNCAELQHRALAESCRRSRPPPAPCRGSRRACDWNVPSLAFGVASAQSTPSLAGSGRQREVLLQRAPGQQRRRRGARGLRRACGNWPGSGRRRRSRPSAPSATISCSNGLVYAKRKRLGRANSNCRSRSSCSRRRARSPSA